MPPPSPIYTQSIFQALTTAFNDANDAVCDQEGRPKPFKQAIDAIIYNYCNDGNLLFSLSTTDDTGDTSMYLEEFQVMLEDHNVDTNENLPPVRESLATFLIACLRDGRLSIDVKDHAKIMLDGKTYDFEGNEIRDPLEEEHDIEVPAQTGRVFEAMLNSYNRAFVARARHIGRPSPSTFEIGQFLDEFFHDDNQLFRFPVESLQLDILRPLQKFHDIMRPFRLNEIAKVPEIPGWLAIVLEQFFNNDDIKFEVDNRSFNA